MSEEPSRDFIADACSNHQKLQARWENMFEKLKDYKQQHGNCLVPNRYEKDRSLGSWVSTQRRYYKFKCPPKCSKDRRNPQWNENRIAMLRDIGFEWVASDPRHTPWETRFRELCEYKERFGEHFSLGTITFQLLF
jgi:Helicase associated domain